MNLDGLSTRDEIFAVRLLEFARLTNPQGNRVNFVHACEAHGIRGFLETFPDTWAQITDVPIRPGIEPIDSYRAFWSERSQQNLEVLNYALEKLQALDVPYLLFSGPAPTEALHVGEAVEGLPQGEIRRPEFEEAKILISPSDLNGVLEQLDLLGFNPLYPDALRAGQEEAWHYFGHGRTFAHDDPCASFFVCTSLFSPILGSDIGSFDTCWSTRREMGNGHCTLGEQEQLLWRALSGVEHNWSKLSYLLDLSIALENLKFDWQQVLAVASYRRVLVERAVELCVRLLGVPHPSEMTCHYRSYEHALESYLVLSNSSRESKAELTKPGSWSCDARDALRRRLWTLSCPTTEDIEEMPHSTGSMFLYRLWAFFRRVVPRRSLKDEPSRSI